MTSDSDTPIQDLKDRIGRFAREREWDQFHSPKNLSMALAVETAELMELFQWKTEEETRGIPSDPKALRRVREEIADVAVYLLNLCNRLNIDLALAVIEKVAQNARRYPIELVKGKSMKYTDVARLSRRGIGLDAAPWRQLELGLEQGDDGRHADPPSLVATPAAETAIS